MLGKGSGGQSAVQNGHYGECDGYPLWRWLRVRWGKEQTAWDFLRAAYVPSYWPNYAVNVTVSVRARNRWRQERLRPLLPGYIFVAPHGDGWQEAVERTPGITGIIRAPDGKPARISQADIDLIRRIEARENTPVPGGIHSFKLGQKVRFTEDVHKSWPPGVISRLYKDGRIGIDTPVLGRIVEFCVYPHQIEAM